MAVTNLPIVGPVTGQESQHGATWVQIIWEALKILLPFVAGYFAHFLQSRRENSARVRREKDAFGVFVRQKIGAVPTREIMEFYKTTKPEIRDAVQRLRHYLPLASDQSAIDDLWIKYDAIPADKLDDDGMAQWVAGLMAATGDKAFQSPREVLAASLEQFYQFSK